MSSRVPTSAPRPSYRARRSVVAVAAVVIAGYLALTGCTLPEPAGAGAAEQSTTSQAPAQATLTVTPSDGAEDVPIIDAVSATVADGTLTKVVLTNNDGKVIDGILTPDKTSWKPAVPLGYGRTYTLATTYAGADGVAKTDTRAFTMADPQDIVTPQLVTSGGNALESHREYGVGIIAGVRFDQAIKDKSAVEKLLSVTTDPPVQGAWYWLNDTTVHWRPKDYYATGTTVRIDAPTYGKNLGSGQYGGDNASANFTIGIRRVAIADDKTKQVVVYENQKPVRTMPTSMGQGGYATFGGVSMHFWTQRGTYTVLDKSSPVIMDSSTYGLPVNSHLGYKETIYNAVRISNDGIYLHRLDESVWAQGSTNTSHGCLNLNAENSRWYFDHAVQGDVVQVLNTGGPPLEAWQNGDWSVPWDEWIKGGQKA